MVEIRMAEYSLRDAMNFCEDTRNEKALSCDDYDVITTIDSDNVYSEEVFNIISRYRSEITPYGYRDTDTCTVYYAVFVDSTGADYEDVVYAEWGEPVEDNEYYDDTYVPNYANWEDM